MHILTLPRSREAAVSRLAQRLAAQAADDTPRQRRARWAEAVQKARGHLAEHRAAECHDCKLAIILPDAVLLAPVLIHLRVHARHDGTCGECEKAGHTLATLAGRWIGRHAHKEDEEPFRCAWCASFDALEIALRWWQAEHHTEADRREQIILAAVEQAHDALATALAKLERCWPETKNWIDTDVGRPAFTAGAAVATMRHIVSRLDGIQALAGTQDAAVELPWQRGIALALRPVYNPTQSAAILFGDGSKRRADLISRWRYLEDQRVLPTAKSRARVPRLASRRPRKR